MENWRCLQLQKWEERGWSEKASLRMKGEGQERALQRRLWMWDNGRREAFKPELWKWPWLVLWRESGLVSGPWGPILRDNLKGRHWGGKRKSYLDSGWCQLDDNVRWVHLTVLKPLNFRYFIKTFMVIKTTEGEREKKYRWDDMQNFSFHGPAF